MTLLEFFLLLAVIYGAVKLGIFLYKRLRLLFGVLSLRKTEGVAVKIISPLAFICPKITKRAAFSVSVSGRTYTVRIFNGKSQRHAAHIANERYAALALKTGGEVRVRQTPAGREAVTDDVRVYFPRTVFLPSEEIADTENSVIVFSPSPRELTYVTKAKTSIRVALVGDEVYGSRVFTKTTFINFIDRLSRGIIDA